MSKNDSTSTKASASRREALRAQQAAQARAARNRRMVGIGAGLIAALLAIILIVVAVQSMNSGGGAVIPPNAVVNQYGVQGGTNPQQTKDGIGIAQDKAKADAPVVQLYADYQCPGCKAFDDAFGEQLNSLARSGDIKYSVQIETFLDRLGANKSTDPAIAAACADTVGKFPEYHLTIYKNQPAKEGTGYTADQLRSTFAQSAGIAGDDLTKFQQCVSTRATGTFVESQNKFNSAWTSAQYTKLGGQNSAEGSAWGSTPLLTVNGKRVDTSLLNESDPNSLMDNIKKVAAS